MNDVKSEKNINTIDKKYQKARKVCRWCWKQRICYNVNVEFRLFKHAWKNGYEVIYGLWICKKDCIKNYIKREEVIND